MNCTDPQNCTYTEKEKEHWSKPIRAQALELAISAVSEAWAILDVELQKDGFDDRIPPFEGGSRYAYYCDLDTQTLEDSDSVYFNSPDRKRKIDDRDLRYFETCFKVHDYFSPRIRALALRTLAKDLVSVASVKREEDLQDALSRIALNSDGSVNVFFTYENYRPYFPLD
ncbi:hypothetical protein [Rhizobium leguminosarum]|uniref:hypothetical protein n=1 Tax=Rhizobium leguminosarum TaxID=384 RepID=UPI00102F8F88|nr:hypothetical protein [Rhizobium leguminosarum]TBF40433.1 hypothetical protein ELG92_10350 [Rhizobium leguminosarum]